MKLSTHRFGLAALMLGIATALPAQTSTQGNDPERGLTEVEGIQSTINSQERLFKLDSNVGWEFNQHFSVYGGVPLYFVNVPSTTTTVGGVTTTTPSTSHNGLGNVYLGFLLKGSNSHLDYAGALTMAAPTASTTDGLSSGRATIDLDNRIQHAFGSFAPFLDAGIGNSVPDSMLFSRPFTSLGFVTHLEEGAGFKLTKQFSVNASAYQILPAGNQKIYSKLVAKGAKGSGKNVFQTSATASGSGLTRENGFNTWVQFEPVPAMDLAVGYTRSETFDLNSFAFNLRMNFGKLLHSKKIS